MIKYTQCGLNASWCNAAYHVNDNVVITDDITACYFILAGVHYCRNVRTGWTNDEIVNACRSAAEEVAQ